MICRLIGHNWKNGYCLRCCKRCNHLDIDVENMICTECKIKLNKGLLYELLCKASCENDLLRCKKLLELGILFGFLKGEEQEKSPLHFAVYHGNLDICKILIEYGFNINQSSRSVSIELNLNIHHEITPIECAVYQNQYEMCKLLLENGADANCKRLNGEYCIGGPLPIDIALSNNNESICSLLVDYGAVIPLNVLIMRGWYDFLEKEIIRHPERIMFYDQNNYPRFDLNNDPLIYAIQRSDLRACEILIQNGADISSPRIGLGRYSEGRRTPLETAELYKKFDIAELLGKALSRYQAN